MRDKMIIEIMELFGTLNDEKKAEFLTFLEQISNGECQ